MLPAAVQKPGEHAAHAAELTPEYEPAGHAVCALDAAWQKVPAAHATDDVGEAQ